MELDNGTNVYGFAFVDCAALKFWVGSIIDDASFSGLGALLMQVCSLTIFYIKFLLTVLVKLKKLNCLIGCNYRCHLKKFCTKVEVNFLVPLPLSPDLFSHFSLSILEC